MGRKGRTNLMESWDFSILFGKFLVISMRVCANSYSNAGGGGERVLWAAIRATQ
jgi:hypothetical protein